MKGYRLKGIRVFRSFRRADNQVRRLNARDGLRAYSSAWRVASWDSDKYHVVFRTIPSHDRAMYAYLRSDGGLLQTSEYIYPWTGVEAR